MDPFIPVRSEPETYEPPSFLVSSTQLSIQDLVRLYHGSYTYWTVTDVIKADSWRENSLHELNSIYRYGPRARFRTIDVKRTCYSRHVEWSS